MECPIKKRKLSENNSNLNDFSNDVNELNDETPTFEKKDPVSNENANFREMMIIDEAVESENEFEGSDGDSSDSELNYDNDIETLLDERLPDDLKSKRKDQQYEEKFKTIVEEKGKNHFEVLPEGWVQVTHDSGIPLYLHRHSRVCSTSRPYFLGPGSVRKHEIPLSSIPCLNYKKALENEKKLMEQQIKKTQEMNVQKNNLDEGVVCPSDNTLEVKPNALTTGLNNIFNIPTSIPQQNSLQLPNAKIETVTENLKAQSLTSTQVIDYCKKLFCFKTIRVMRFKSWSARRKFTKNRKHIKHLQRPTLPDGTKLITFPILQPEISSDSSKPNQTIHNRSKKEWIMNPNGKSYVCILHEYVQHALKKQPTYVFRELENAATPYSATVSINDLKYGTGYGTSKKQAKSEAARETLEVLIPEMREKITKADKNSNNSVGNNKNNPSTQDLSVFDEIRIEDPRVAEFCAKTTEPSPHAILLTCLQRNYGIGDVKIKYEVNTAKHKKNEFTMTVGKHTAKVYCKNKRDGKQRASQAILQILHPHIKTWGSLLRLYGTRSVKSFKEKKQEEQEITVLQSKAAINQPNYAILEKLKLEMNKLNDRCKAVQPIGTLIAPLDMPLSSLNVNVNL